MVGAAFLAQLAASGVAVGVLVGLAAWAKIARPRGPLDEAKVRTLLQDEFPGRELEAVWVGADGKGAVAKSGAAALVLCAVGDGFVARIIPWAQALSAGVRNGHICIDLSDVSAPRATIAIAEWPPEPATRGLAA
jgi:hypothetical protein